VRMGAWWSATALTRPGALSCDRPASSWHMYDGGRTRARSAAGDMVERDSAPSVEDTPWGVGGSRASRAWPWGSDVLVFHKRKPSLGVGVGVVGRARARSV